MTPETNTQLSEELMSIAGHELEYHPTARTLVMEAARRLLVADEHKRSAIFSLIGWPGPRK